jgi:hypothetical protein
VDLKILIGVEARILEHPFTFMLPLQRVLILDTEKAVDVGRVVRLILPGVSVSGHSSTDEITRALIGIKSSIRHQSERWPAKKDGLVALLNTVTLL